MYRAALGTVIVGWSTGNGTIAPNQQAPYYPNATLYAPQTPDPASYNSTVCRTLVSHACSTAPYSTALYSLYRLTCVKVFPVRPNRSRCVNL